jgi:Flp pilus assembly pilin Flp
MRIPKVRWTKHRDKTLARDDSGVTAVEFALVAGPFFLFVVALIELGLTFWADSLLDEATQTTARKIRTGQLQAQAAELSEAYTTGSGGLNGESSGGSSGEEPMTVQELFKQNLCDSMGSLIDCSEESRIKFDVRKYQDFDDVDMTPPESDEEGGMVISQFQPGARDEVILVRTYYKWGLMTPWMKYLLRNKVDSQGNLLLSSTVVFRNEPFPEVASDDN